VPEVQVNDGERHFGVPHKRRISVNSPLRCSCSRQPADTAARYSYPHTLWPSWVANRTCNRAASTLRCRIEPYIDQGGSAPRRRTAPPAAGLWPWEAPPGAGAPSGLAGCTDQTGIGKIAGWGVPPSSSRPIVPVAAVAAVASRAPLWASLTRSASPALDAATTYQGWQL
jgi:hypothetical protein